MALRPTSLLKQATRILSPRTSTPKLKKSPLNLELNVKYNTVSPAANLRTSVIRTPITARIRSKTARKLYADNLSPEDSIFDAPEITVDECVVSQENEDISPCSKRLLSFDTPLREAVFKKKEPFAEIPVLGKGSFGTVVKGLYKGKKAAIKIVNAKKVQTCTSIHNEKNALCLKHKNIVDIYKIVHADPDGENALVIMELIPNGTTLQSFIGYGTTFLSLKQQFSFIVQITSALQYIHEKEIVHLDLKPANILLQDNTLCKLSDFGSSRCISELKGKKFPPCEFLKGTLAYISPEILLGLTPTTKSDIYSLGILMWQLENQLEPYQLTSSYGRDVVLYQVVKYKRRPCSKVTRRPNKFQESYELLYNQCWQHYPWMRPNPEHVIMSIREIQMQQNL